MTIIEKIFSCQKKKAGRLLGMKKSSITGILNFLVYTQKER